MGLGNHFCVSEVSSFFPFASFVFSSPHLFFDDPTRITASCHLAWPGPGPAGGRGGGGHDTESMRCWASDKTSLCLPTWASSLGKQKQGRTILPVHGGIVMVSVLQTMSSVIYSIFLLRKGFPWPAPCQVVWRKDELPGLTRAASAGCKDTTAGLVSAGLPVPWPQPAFPHQDRDHYAIQSPQFPHPGQQALPALPEMS